MACVEKAKPVGNPARVGYAVILATFILMGWLHVATPFLTALFAYLALTKLQLVKRGSKWVAVALFIIFVAAATYSLGHFVRKTVRALPEIADRAIPSLIHWARQHAIELPFTDYDSLKELALDTVKGEVTYLGSAAKLARGVTRQLLFLAVGIVVAISLFLNPRMDLDRERHLIRNNLYSLCCEAIAERFRAFYRSFAMVMGAQIIISAVNTILTAIFILAVGLPYPGVVVGVTFLCGLVPIVGNLVSNTIIVGIGFTVSPQMALAALVFLVLIHKLEYFLNSKIIGHRIRNPLWLTLLGLVLGETLMGVPGMILAPVVLHYLKMEASAVEVRPLSVPVTEKGG